MIDDDVLKLLKSFPRSFINQNGEFIAHEKTNVYFILCNCKDELEIKCKVLEWLSRSVCKGVITGSKKKNEEFRKFMLDGINRYLGTDFDAEQMSFIYQELGNQVSRKKTIKFIESNYEFEFLI